MNQDQKNSPSGSKVQNAQNEETYFDKILYIKRFLQKPTHQRDSFMTIFFKEKQMKKIKCKPEFMAVQFSQKFLANKTSQIKKKQYKLQDPQLEKQMTKTNQDLTNFTKKKDINFKKIEQICTEQYLQLIKQIKGNQLFYGFHIVLTNQGPKLKQMVMTQNFLKLIGYSIEQAALCLQNYKQFAINFGNNTYKQSFVSMAKFYAQIGKLTQQQLKSSQKKKQILQNAKCQLETQIYGKQDRAFSVQVQIYFPIISFLAVRVLKTQKIQNKNSQQILSQKKEIDKKLNRKVYQSLNCVLKLPQSNNPKNQHKLCKYQQLPSETYTKMQQS